MTTLHIINKSPFERNSLDTCLRLAKKGAAILLISFWTWVWRRERRGVSSAAPQGE